MLVNMSMVDAGYEGSLACLFVNFGRSSVDIDPNMTIARLVFNRIDSRNAPYGRGEAPPDYERALREVALHGPSSFLSLKEFTAAFTEEKQKAIDDFITQARASSIQVQTEMRQGINDNLPKFLLKSYGVAAVGFALLALVVTVAPWIQDRFALDINKNIATAVDSALGKRLQPFATVDSDALHELDHRLHDLEGQIGALKQPNSGNLGGH
jgi:hypothetical protein